MPFDIKTLIARRLLAAAREGVDAYRDAAVQRGPQLSGVRVVRRTPTARPAQGRGLGCCTSRVR